jgi:16S rRNA C967 or C1407 C5-methylase (RsmB/RsmF family)
VPNLKQIVYLTHSIHKEENEDVILDALDKFGDDWYLDVVLPEFTSDIDFDPVPGNDDDTNTDTDNTGSIGGGIDGLKGFNGTEHGTLHLTYRTNVY